ncbi:MAG: prepilin-type N-terminal cleavage/methylation domain-containing protein [Desulfobacteraceae bacterium]|nr:prepilin-type N-terminal cleavage/methylation domain-containing protein [Desulfobacteraceae bacterium]
MCKLHDNNSGFTLIEVLVAMVILSIGLLGTAALITGIIRGNQVSNRVTTATTLAQDKMEDIKRLGYSNTVSETRASLSSPYDQYEREVSVVVGSPATGMKTVTVEVYWDTNKSVSLQTILSG